MSNGGYVGAMPIPKALQVLTEGTLTLASSTISIPGGYTPGNIGLWINGIRLKSNLFTAIDGFTIDLLETYPIGTEYIIEEYRAFEVNTNTGAQAGVFYENDQLLLTDYTITAGKNAMSAGPIEINDGATVTIPDGSFWTIV